jgi:uncharacterized membrane protein
MVNETFMIRDTELLFTLNDFKSMEGLELFATYTLIILEAAGVGIILIGAVYSTIIAAGNLFRKEADTYLHYRRSLSRAILLGLEFLVAADIIRTVVVDLTFSSIGVLGLLILIRTFLSFTLEVEISGRWPWQTKDGDPVEH